MDEEDFQADDPALDIAIHRSLSDLRKYLR
jgi:hypothetical protein